MRILHRRTYLPKQLEPAGHCQLVAFTIEIDSFALDQFHDQVRHAVGGGTAIQQTRDVGMVERRQNLPFIAESLVHRSAIDAAANQFDRHFLGVLSVGANRAIDLAHATYSDTFQGFVGTHTAAGTRLSREHVRSRIGKSSVVQELRIHLVLLVQEQYDFATQRLITGAELFQANQPVRSRRFQDGRQSVFDLLPAFGSHGVALLLRARCSHKRAVAHSRLAVAGEILTASAASSMESPPKKRNSTILHWRESSAAN